MTTTNAATVSTLPAPPMRAQDVFRTIGNYLGAHPDLVAKTKTVFLFKVLEPESNWLLDMKNGGGSLSNNLAPADITLIITEANLLALSKGEVDPMSLFFSKKLQISGNVMTAAGKLAFLNNVFRGSK